MRRQSDNALPMHIAAHGVKQSKKKTHASGKGCERCLDSKLMHRAGKGGQSAETMKNNANEIQHETRSKSLAHTSHPWGKTQEVNAFDQKTSTNTNTAGVGASAHLTILSTNFGKHCSLSHTHTASPHRIARTHDTNAERTRNGFNDGAASTTSIAS